LLRGWREAGALKDKLLELADINPFLWVAFKDHAKDVVQFIRQWQDGLQKIPVLFKSPVSGIFLGSLFPWVAAARKINKDYTQGPDVVGSTSVRWFPGRLVQTFWTHVKGRSTTVVLGFFIHGCKAKVGK
jgi:hypothetical protein